MGGIVSRFLPGTPAIWEGQAVTVVDIEDMKTVLVKLPGKRNAIRAAIEHLRTDRTGTAASIHIPDLAKVPEKAWQQALAQLDAIRPLLEMGMSRRTFADVQEVASAQGKHPATIYRWIDDYTRTRRASVFLRKVRSDQGKNRIPAAVEAVIKKAIEDKYLTSEKQDPAAVIEEVQLLCRQAGLKQPHENTVRRRISMLADRTKLEKRGSKKAAAQRFDPLIGHFPGAGYPLAVAQIDHTPMDIIVVDEQDRQPINRPQLTIVLDVYSKMVLGFAIYLEHPSAFTSGLAISHAVLPKDEWLQEMGVSADWPCWGKMRKLHCDNAKEFRGTLVGRACQEHNIDVEHRPKGTPHYGGHVERGFRTFMKRTHRLRGTTFSNVAEKAEYDSDGRAHMTRAELEKWFTIYIAKYYPNRYHRGIKDTPLARYKAGILGTDGQLGIGLPERVADPTRFMLDFMPVQERTVQEYGLLIDHIYYYDDALRPWIHARDPADPTKARKFIVRFNPRDMREVYFWDPTSDTYIPIPYRDRSRPPVSRWEVLAAEERLRKLGYSHVNEDLLFDSLLEMREVEEASLRRTKKIRREREKRLQQPRLPAPLAVPAPQRPVPEVPLVISERPLAPSAEIEAFDGIVEPD